MAEIILFVILGVAVAVVAWAIADYNKLVRRRTMVKEGWSGIDVQLKRRANLIETVKGYMGHERGVLAEVTELRQQSMGGGTPGQKGPIEGALSRALGKLFAVAEAYPDLKASRNFADLQDELAETEDQIQLARRYYNGATRDLNILIEQFPSNLVAGRFRFIQAEFFEIEDAADRAVPEVKF